ncbi:MAG: ABC transporter ATP-binding protein [Thermoclostridium sp.]|nr:ABC transporter ATP-binding protein [Thermoclostridium sp.]
MGNIIRHAFKRIREGILQDIWESTRWMYQYARRYWKQMIIYTLIGLSGTAISLVSSLLSKDLVDIITGHQTGLLIKTFSLFIGFSIGNVIISQISGYLSVRISLTVDNEIKKDIFDNILLTDWEPISAYHSGDLLNRWLSDVSVISSSVLNFIPSLIINIVRFLSSFIIILNYDWSFALFALAGFPVSLLLSRTLLKRMRNNNMESARMGARMSGFNQEAFYNLQTIKAFGILDLYSAKLKQLQADYMMMRMRFQKMSITTSVIMSVVGIIVSNACYGWGIYRVWSGAITYGTMTMFLGLSGSLTGNLNTLMSTIPNAISITTSVKRLREILDLPREDYLDEPLVDELYQISRTEGISLSIQNIDYAYRNGTRVFENSCFLAQPHEIVALVGPSGEGKTTMLRILLALLHPQSGQCLLYAGSTPDKPIPLTPAARKLFSYVPQGNTMFTGTIAENMRNVKPDATDEEIVDALKLACAWSFVEKLPETINSVIRERGGGFSEGQAQRLSIARALLRKSPVLFLDEATSALDVATERNVLRNIMQDNYPRTCIITSHRPTVLEMCSKVYGIRNLQCEELTKDEINKMINDF